MTDLTFWQQIVARLKSKSPLLFRIIMWLASVLFVVSAVLTFLTWVGVTLPGWLDVVEGKCTLIATAIAAIIAKLPVDTPEATAQVLAQTMATDSTSTTTTTINQ